MLITLDTGDFGSYLLTAEDGRDILVQVDFDYCGIAEAFGWSPAKAGQMHCHLVDGAHDECGGCPGEDACEHFCPHDSTDGTVDCSCGMKAGDFIQSASEWLDDHIGDSVEDPGYFGEDA